MLKDLSKVLQKLHYCQLKLMIFSSYIFIVIFLQGILVVNSEISKHPLLIVVSFDGFRHDYFNRPKVSTPNLDKLKSSGATVQFMRNQFETKTFPNHHSIVTGLHTESHGVIDNWLFDPFYNETLNEYSPESGEKLYNFDSRVIPIWILNEWAGDDRRSGVMMWPGATHRFGTNLTKPHYSISWNITEKWENRVDKLIEWMTGPNPTNLNFLYFEEPDEEAHSFGPESIEVSRVIEKLDKIAGYLVESLKSAGIFEQTNLIFLSDHGFQEVKLTNMVNISSIVDPKKYKTYGSTPVLTIYPNEVNGTKALIDAFKNASKTSNFSAFLKDEIPEHWHYKNNRRVGPILLVADLGFVFDDFYQSVIYYNKKSNRTFNLNNSYGVHGYDNNQIPMHPFFIAHGPLFRSGLVADPFENIDLFPLISHLIGIETQPNNGSFTHVSILLQSSNFTFNNPIGWIIGGTMVISLPIIFGIWTVMLKRQNTSHRLVSDVGYRYVKEDEIDMDGEFSELLGGGRKESEEELETFVPLTATASNAKLISNEEMADEIRRTNAIITDEHIGLLASSSTLVI